MGTIRIRFILVALAVGFFAIGMAAFLNYFKYKSTFGEIVTRSSRAVRALTTVSYFAGCSIGSSAGLAPLKIRSAKLAARRHPSGKFTPKPSRPRHAPFSLKGALGRRNSFFPTSIFKPDSSPRRRPFWPDSPKPTRITNPW